MITERPEARSNASNSCDFSGCKAREGRYLRSLARLHDNIARAQNALPARTAFFAASNAILLSHGDGLLRAS